MRRCAWLFIGLFALAVPDAEAAFGGKAGRIVFAAQGFSGDHSYTLKELDPRTKKVRQLTVPSCTAADEFGTRWSDRAPDYSADGRHIAYLHSDGCPGAEAGQRQGVWLMKADGSEARWLVPLRAAGLDSEYRVPEAAVAFSPDSRRIAVNYIDLNELGGSSHWHKVFSAIDGALLAERRIALPEYSHGPQGLDWSSGNRIAAGIRERIHVLRPNGARLRVFRTRPSWPVDSWPDWSPSGRTLVYTRDRSENEGDVGGGEIMRVSARGGRATRRLSRDRYGRGYFYSPVISPEARRIAFSSGSDLFVMGTRRGRPRRLTRGRDFVGELDWQPLPRR